MEGVRKEILIKWTNIMEAGARSVQETQRSVRLSQRVHIAVMG